MTDPTEQPVDDFDTAFGDEAPPQDEPAAGDTDNAEEAAAATETDDTAPADGDDQTDWAQSAEESGGDDASGDDEGAAGQQTGEDAPPKGEDAPPVDPKAFLLDELGPAFVRDPEKRTVENVVHNVKSWNGRLRSLREENEQLKRDLEAAKQPAAETPAQPESASEAAPGSEPAPQGPTDEDRRLARDQLAQEHGGTLPEWVDDNDIDSRARQIEQWRTTSKRTVEEALDERLKPIQQHVEQSEAEKAQEVRRQHFDTIAQAHEDYEAVVSDDDFELWLSQLPSIERPAYERVVNQGTADEVVEMLDRYKRERGIATPGDSQETPPPKPQPRREAPRREPSAPAAGPGRNAAGKGGFEDGWGLPDARA